MGGKYEVRYYLNEETGSFMSDYTNNWFKFVWLVLTKKVIYYKVQRF